VLNLHKRTFALNFGAQNYHPYLKIPFIYNASVTEKYSLGGKHLFLRIVEHLGNTSKFKYKEFGICRLTDHSTLKC
jgi:hypothetical protein